MESSKKSTLSNFEKKYIKDEAKAIRYYIEQMRILIKRQQL